MRTESGHPGQEGFDLVLRLLDHQVVGPGGELLGNVDNLEVQEVGGDLLVTGILVGPAGLGPRLPGKLGRWTYAIWRRLSPCAEPTATVLPMSQVQHIGSGIEVSAWGSRSLAQTFGFERWLRRYVIARIPGATHADDAGDPGDEAAPASADPAGDPSQLSPAEGSHLVSDLLGREVLDPGGTPLGHVCGLLCEAAERSGPRVGSLRITGVAYGRRPAGSTLGYRADRHQGPLVVAAVIRRWHRDDKHVSIDAVVPVDWALGKISLRSGAQPRHPHDDA
jgi:sporulation protein YlmC with PRC-barrel domain